MADFLLIHGSMQGGWVWGPVGTVLQRAGHRVLRPTLDGSSERAALLRPEITLESQGSEIARLMFFEDLQDVILVSISIGGMVAASAAQSVPERIRRLVFIDALLPMPGETVAEINGETRDERDLAYGYAPHEVAERAFHNVEPPALRAWAQARYTRQPRIPVHGPVDLNRFWELRWQADVLRCKRGRNPREAHQRRNAERLGASYSEIDAGHYPQLTNVDELSRYLLEKA